MRKTWIYFWWFAINDVYFHLTEKSAENNINFIVVKIEAWKQMRTPESIMMNYILSFRWVIILHSNQKCKIEITFKFFCIINSTKMSFRDKEYKWFVVLSLVWKRSVWKSSGQILKAAERDTVMWSLELATIVRKRPHAPLEIMAFSPQVMSNSHPVGWEVLNFIPRTRPLTSLRPSEN